MQKDSTTQSVLFPDLLKKPGVHLFSATHYVEKCWRNSDILGLISINRSPLLRECAWKRGKGPARAHCRQLV
jgi:hypothetical protein